MHPRTSVLSFQFVNQEQTNIFCNNDITKCSQFMSKIMKNKYKKKKLA